MKKLLTILFALFVFSYISHIPTYSQSVTVQGGTVNVLLANGKRLGVGTPKPTTCVIADLWYDTAAVAGSNWFGCTTANTWTLEGGTSATPTLQAVLNAGSTATTLNSEANSAQFGDGTRTIKLWCDATNGCVIKTVPSQDSVTQLSTGLFSRLKNNSGIDMQSMQEAATGTPSTFLMDMPAPLSAGTRNSHSLQLRGSSFDTVGHTVDWQTLNNVTSNAGASTYIVQSRIDAGTFVPQLKLGNSSTILDTATVLNSLLLSNLTNPQGHRVYNTTDATFTNTEYGSLVWGANAFVVSTNSTGTGILRELRLGSSNAPTRLRTTCATPSAPALVDGDWWVDTVAGNCVTATGTISLKSQNNGIVRTIASVTF